MNGVLENPSFYFDSKEDFALLMNLVGGEDNNAIGSELKNRLTTFDLNRISTANNYYSTFFQLKFTVLLINISR